MTQREIYEHGVFAWLGRLFDREVTFYSRGRAQLQREGLDEGMVENILEGSETGYFRGLRGAPVVSADAEVYTIAHSRRVTGRFVRGDDVGSIDFCFIVTPEARGNKIQVVWMNHH